MPLPNGALPGTEIISIDLVIERQKYGGAIVLIYTHQVSITAKPTRSGVKGKLDRQ